MALPLYAHSPGHPQGCAWLPVPGTQTCPAALGQLVSSSRHREHASESPHMEGERIPTSQSRAQRTQTIAAPRWSPTWRCVLCWLTDPRLWSLAPDSLPPGKDDDNHPMTKQTSLRSPSSYRPLAGEGAGRGEAQCETFPPAR